MATVDCWSNHVVRPTVYHAVCLGNDPTARSNEFSKLGAY